MTTTRRRTGVSAMALLCVLGCGGDGSTSASGTAGVSVASEWPMYGFDVSQSRFNSRETALTAASAAQLKQAWKKTTGGAVSATPAVVGGVVYFGAWDHSFYALDVSDGAELWRVETLTPQGDDAGYPGIQSSAAVAGGRVYFGDSCGYLHAYPADGRGATPSSVTERSRGCGSSGTESPGFPIDLGAALPDKDDAKNTDIFSSPIPYSPSRGPNAGRSLIYIGASSHVDQPCIHGALFAIDANDGTIVWRFDVVPSDAIGGAIWSTPAIDRANDLVYIDTGDCVQNGSRGFSESIVALDASCSGISVDGSCPGLAAVAYPPFGSGAHPTPNNPVWAFQSHPNGEIADFDFGSSPNVITDAAGNPLLVGAGSKDGAYYAVHAGRGADGGKLAWTTRIVNLQTDVTTVTVGNAIGTLAGAFQGSTGFADGKVFATTLTGPEFAFALDGRSGTLKWDALDATTSFSPVAIAGGLVVAGDNLGLVRIRDANTGLLKAVLPIGGPITGGPVVANGMIFVGAGLPTSQLPGLVQGLFAFRP